MYCTNFILSNAANHNELQRVTNLFYIFDPKNIKTRASNQKHALNNHVCFLMMFNIFRSLLCHNQRDHFQAFWYIFIIWLYSLCLFFFVSSSKHACTWNPNITDIHLIFFVNKVMDDGIHDSLIGGTNSFEFKQYDSPFIDSKCTGVVMHESENNNTRCNIY